MGVNDTNRPDDWSLEDLDYKASGDLLGFFELLIEVARRNNPDLYENSNAGKS